MPKIEKVFIEERKVIKNIDAGRNPLIIAKTILKL